MLNHGSLIFGVVASASVKYVSGSIVAIPIVKANMLKAISFFLFSFVFSLPSISQGGI
jgi:hypothetical protein